MLLVAACGSGSEVPTLTWYINPDNGGQARLAEKCAPPGGPYKVDIQTLPNDASQQREQLVRRLAAQDSSIDLMSLDPPFVAEFANAGFLKPFDAQDEQSLTEGVPLSVGEEPPQAASNRLAAISVSTKPFRLTLILIISCLLSALQWSGW